MLSRRPSAAGLGGLEHLAGIPGTVGAALAINSGIINGDIGSRVAQVTGRAIRRVAAFEARQLQFGFRRSNLEDRVIVEAEFLLRHGDAAESTRRMQANWMCARCSAHYRSVRYRPLSSPRGLAWPRAGDGGVRDTREGDCTMDAMHPGFVQ